MSPSTALLLLSSPYSLSSSKLTVISYAIKLFVDLFYRFSKGDPTTPQSTVTPSLSNTLLDDVDLWVKHIIEYDC